MKNTNFLDISEREVFILRFWKPAEPNTPLRGQLQHIRSGQIIPLQNPVVILQAIQEQAETAGEKKAIRSGIK